MRLSLLRLFLPLLLALSCAGQPLTLKPGESFVFRVSWGPLEAGLIDVAALDAGDAQGPRTEIVIHTATAGLVRALYSFDGEARSLFDASDGRLLSASATTRAKNRRTDASITLDHETASAAYVDHTNSARDKTMPLPQARAMDLVTSLVEARAWLREPGDERRVSVLFDNEFYELRLKALRFETVSTEKGRREALLVAPSMEGKPRGLFKRGGSIRVWLDRAPPHLPLRFEVETRAGTATALLVSHKSGSDGRLAANSR